MNLCICVFVYLCISKWHCLTGADCGVLQVGWFTNSICSICGKFRFYSNIKPPHAILPTSFKTKNSDFCIFKDAQESLAPTYPGQLIGHFQMSVSLDRCRASKHTGTRYVFFKDTANSFQNSFSKVYFSKVYLSKVYMYLCFSIF